MNFWFVLVTVVLVGVVVAWLLMCWLERVVAANISKAIGEPNRYDGKLFWVLIDGGPELEAQRDRYRGLILGGKKMCEKTFAAHQKAQQQWPT